MAGQRIITKVEAVVNDVRVECTYEGYSATEAIEDIREQDADAKFHTDLTSNYSKGSYGKKDTQKTTAKSMNIEHRKGKTYVVITCENSEDNASTVKVSSKNIDTFVSDIEALSVVSDEKIGKIKDILDGSKSGTVILKPEDYFEVNYYEYEGAYYADSFAKAEA